MTNLAVDKKRENLMARKLEIDDKLSEAKIALQEAEALARAEGKYMPPREHAAMKRNVSFLGRESQRLQFELRGDRKQVHDLKDEKGQLFMQEFFMIAKRTVDNETFRNICKQAESNLNDAVAKKKANAIRVQS